MTRRRLLDAVSRGLGDRTLIWSGLRGSDADSLGDLPAYEGNFSIIDRHVRRPLAASVSYEDLTGRREDMEAWDVSEHPQAAATKSFRHQILAATVSPCALVPYRASRFLSAIWFARQDRCLNLGMFGDAQRAFEHKPWVEWSIAQLGVPGLDWQYIADEEQLRARDYLAEGPVMLRRSTSSGGSGFTLVTQTEQLFESWPQQDESFVGISRYLAGTVPVNVGAVAWEDTVTVHHASVQLIGLPGFVTRPFGYCGNDFAAAKDLPTQIIDQIEEHTQTIGRWLIAHGYRGAFGADYLVSDGVPLFTEVNPRFQGSTAASSRLSVEAGMPCLLLEHVGAFLHITPEPRPPLRDQVRDARDLAQVVVHWTGPDARIEAGSLVGAIHGLDPTVMSDVVVPSGIVSATGATVSRLTVRGVLYHQGHIPSAWHDVIDSWNRQMKEDADAAWLQQGPPPAL